MYEMANDTILLMAQGSHTVKMHMMLMTAAKPYQLYFVEVKLVRVSTSGLKKNWKPLYCFVIFLNTKNPLENYINKKIWE